MKDSVNKISAGQIGIKDGSLTVVKESDLQSYVEASDSALLKARGTGINGTTVSVAVGGTTFTLSAITGEISSDAGYFSINYAGATNVTVTDLNVLSTYIYIDNQGVLQQQTTKPTREEWVRKLFVCRIAININTNQIIAFEYLSNPSGQYANNSRDIYDFLLEAGIPLKKGLIITPNASANLTFNISAGTLLEFGGTGQFLTPNTLTFNSISALSFFRLKRDIVLGTTSNIDATQWDNGGTLENVPNNNWTSQRVYFFGSGNISVQYGQDNYQTIELAKAGVSIEPFVLNPTNINGTFLGWWFVQESVTDLTNIATAEFRAYTIGTQSGSGSSSGSLLASNNLSDVDNATTSLSNLDGIKKTGASQNVGSLINFQALSQMGFTASQIEAAVQNTIANKVWVESRLFSGNYNDLTNKPVVINATSIAANVKQINDSINFGSNVQFDSGNNISFQGTTDGISYNDLDDKPSIPPTPEVLSGKATITGVGGTPTTILTMENNSSYRAIIKLDSTPGQFESIIVSNSVSSSGTVYPTLFATGGRNQDFFITSISGNLLKVQRAGATGASFSISWTKTPTF